MVNLHFHFILVVQLRNNELYDLILWWTVLPDYLSEPGTHVPNDVLCY